ncbi:MAG: AbrB/MazE/SpoVT family DNA-binding domain-containing protein [Candidatus Thorarchaeota archaeon]
MRTTLKIVKIGNSKGVIIPSHITERLNLDIDDLVEIDIKKIEDNI